MSLFSLQNFHCNIGGFHCKIGNAFPPKSSPHRPKQECLAKRDFIDKQLVVHKPQSRPGMSCNTLGNSRMTLPAPAAYSRQLSYIDTPRAWESKGAGSPSLLLSWAFAEAGRAGLRYLGRPAGGLLLTGNGFQAEDSRNAWFWILEKKSVPLGGSPLSLQCGLTIWHREV